MQAVEESLVRVGMDYIDLYQVHRFDYETPIEETIAALDDVAKAGKVLYIGASSMFAYQFSRYRHRAEALGCTPFAMMQPQYNLLYREEEREMRSEEHTSELQSLMRHSYAVFCLKKKK